MEDNEQSAEQGLSDFQALSLPGSMQFSKLSKLDLAKSIQHPTTDLVFFCYLSVFCLIGTFFLQSFQRHALEELSLSEPQLSPQCHRWCTEGHKCAFNIRDVSQGKALLLWGK